MTLMHAFSLYLNRSFSKRHIDQTRSIERKVKRYVAWRKEIRQMADYEVYLDNLDAEAMSDFRDFIANEHILYKEHPDFYSQFYLRPSMMKEISPNTITAVMARLTFVLNWCVKQGYTENRKYKSFDHGVLVYGSPFYMTIEERDFVYNADLTGWPSHMVQHRDKFIFQCLVGCRYGDLEALTKDNIVEDFLEYIPKKTLHSGEASVVRIPLNDKAKAILARQETKDNRLFPHHARYMYNDDIKLLLNLLGINRQVTIINRHTRKEEQHPLYELASSHMARRTFIGNLYKQVKDQELVASLTGHAEGSKAFSRYRIIDDEMKREKMDLNN